MNSLKCLSILFVLFIPFRGSAQECCHWPTLPQAATHQPEHPFSVGLSYGYTQSDGLQSGSHSAPETDAGENYTAFPSKMTSHRIEARASYEFDPRYSIGLRLPWVYNKMDMDRITGILETPMTDHSGCGDVGHGLGHNRGGGLGHKHDTHTMDPVEGVGDLRIEGTLRLLEEGSDESGVHRLYLRPALKTPTGEYKEKAHGGYADPCMQPGTGSWDPIVELEYRFEKAKFGISLLGGYQLTTRNPEGYEYGDIATLGIFPSYQPLRMLRLTSGLRYRYVDRSEDHKGRYTDMANMTKDPANTGGNLADAIVSLDLLPTETLTLSTGVSLPVWSDLNGIQQQPGEIYTVGASMRF